MTFRFYCYNNTKCTLYRYKSPQNNMTALPTMKTNNGYVPPTGTAVQPDPYYEDQDSTSYETAANSYDAPEDVGEKKASGLRKLMKRKPLNK